MDKRISRNRAIFFFFFNDTATTEIYTLSLHDALPISDNSTATATTRAAAPPAAPRAPDPDRSEEHTSELQSQSNLVCRLLLEKKKKKNTRQVCHHITRRTRELVITDSRHPTQNAINVS